MDNIEIKIDGEDQALLLLRSLPSEFDNLSNTLIHGRDTISLKEAQAALSSKELKQRSQGRGNQTGEELYTRGKSEKRDSKNKKGLRSKSRNGKKEFPD